MNMTKEDGYAIGALLLLIALVASLIYAWYTGILEALLAAAVIVILIIFFAAAFLTQVMSNIPTILLFMPIGVSIAEAIGVSPYPICMIITLAGAASYATPFAAPQNMMTVGWTQYKFLDFLKIGIPMLLVTYIVIIAVTPFYLPY